MSSQQCVSQSIIQDKHGLVWLQDAGLMDGWMDEVEERRDERLS